MKYLMIPLFLVILSATALAASLDASVNPKSVAPGSDMKLTIKTVGVPNGKWFVAYDITLGGGCVRKENSQTIIKDFLLDEVSADQTKDYNIKAPSTEGSCTFNVKYQFTGSSEQTINFNSEIKAPKAPEPKKEVTPTPKIPKTGRAFGWGANPQLIGLIIVGAIVVIGLIIYFVITKKKR